MPAELYVSRIDLGIERETAIQADRTGASNVQWVEIRKLHLYLLQLWAPMAGEVMETGGVVSVLIGRF